MGNVEINLKELDVQGWVLAPHETLEQLLYRKQILEKNREMFSLNTVFLSSKAHEITDGLYQFSLKDVPVFYSDTSLSLWEGAVLWSYFDENGKAFPVIQMRSNYKKGFLRFYKEEEILAHELVHAARFAFKEPIFEEMFAYKTSKNFFPRFLGPLFIFRIESLLCIILVLASFLGFGFLGWTFFLWLPSLVFACLFFRLLCLHFVLSLAKGYEEDAGKKNPLSCLFRCSDKEIFRAALIRTGQLKKKFIAWFQVKN